jgi:hypothetical protein
MTTETFTASDLFNNCTDHRAPEWSQFATLEIGACKDDPADPGHTIGLLTDDAEAEFFTVYGRHHSGEAEAITDCPTRSRAEQVAAELCRISGLPMSKG